MAYNGIKYDVKKRGYNYNKLINYSDLGKLITKIMPCEIALSDFEKKLGSE